MYETFAKSIATSNEHFIYIQGASEEQKKAYVNNIGCIQTSAVSIRQANGEFDLE